MARKKAAIEVIAEAPDKSGAILWAIVPMVIAVAFISAATSIWVNNSISTLSSRVDHLSRATDAAHRNFRMTDDEWRKVYVEYNRDYFSGKLPVAVVESKDDIGSDVFGETSFDSDGIPHIWMNALTINGNKEAHSTLLHEMIHVKLHNPSRVTSGGGFIILGGDDGHGEEFMKELHRLLTLGAFDDLLG